MDTERDQAAAAEPFATVSISQARSEMERVLGDPEFRCADRNKKFLRFVSEELFAGREETVKAYSIAVDVFGRPATFDPTIDPIVHIEATRLRSALAHYYDVHGHDRDVLIELPKGRYVPLFSRNAVRRSAPAETNSENLPQRKTPIPTGSAFRRKLPAALGIVGALLALLFAAGVGWFGGRALARISEKPVVSIELASGAHHSREAAAIRDSLLVAVSSFQTLRLVMPESVVAAGGPSPEAFRSRYRVFLKHSSKDNQMRLWWQLVDGETGEVLRTGQESAPRGDASPPVDAQLVSRLAIRLASAGGVINTIETARDLEHPSLGNGCILRSRVSLEARSVISLSEAVSCLERTLSRRPYDADAHAVLATVLVALDELNGSNEEMKPAVEHSNAAAALAPDSDRSQMALMVAAFHAGRPEAAVSAGRRALELNPHNMAATARLARILFSVGRWQEGVELAVKASTDGQLQRDAELTFALEAYRRGYCGEAALRLQQFPDTTEYFVQLLLAASLGCLGEQREADVVISRIRDQQPYFHSTLHADLREQNLAPSLVAALADGLALAGVRTDKAIR